MANIKSNIKLLLKFSFLLLIPCVRLYIPCDKYKSTYVLVNLNPYNVIIN